MSYYASHNGKAPASSPYTPEKALADDNDSPIVGRSVNHIGFTNPVPSGNRLDQPPVPSPLRIGANRSLTDPGGSNSRQDNSSPRQPRTRATDPQSGGDPYLSAVVEQTSFYSDSSNAPSPEPPSPRPAPRSVPNETRSASDTLISKPAKSPPKAAKPAMPGPTELAQDPSTGLPRNSSIDSAISAISTKAGPQNGVPQEVPTNAASGSPDVASLIRKAGSPEALVQSLLKDKNSQSQQNSQLWRLVDKQRAMILGLNKDLERALKEKEKYRTKLKDMMADPAVSKAAGVLAGRKDSETLSPTHLQAIDIAQAAERPESRAPGSPTSDLDSPQQSPIDAVLAPYPVTPPSDQFNTGQVVPIVESPKAMPKHQEHAHNKYDHEAADRVAEQTVRTGHPPREKPGSTSPRDINPSLPPSQGLPPDPPKGPPPKPPAQSPPSVSVSQASPRAGEDLPSFPSPPPRKAPPAPLQLKSDVPENAIDEDTDSDLDDILDAAGLGEKRGRRRTRAEDDRDREIRAWKEAEARSASMKSTHASAGNSKPGSPTEPLPPSPRAIQPPSMPALAQEPGTASLNAMLQGGESKKDVHIPAPMMSPGLPASPRPMAKQPLHSPPLSPRNAASFQQSALSPRPPRQPVPHPPNTPAATPAASLGDATTKAHNAAHQALTEPNSASSRDQDSPTERTRIYKGLVTDEFPDLLLPPNALPSIAIRVASSRMKPSRASLVSLTQLEEDPVFTLAIISRSDGGELWRVEKDLASLSKLDGRMKQCGNFNAQAPDRSLFTGHAPARVDARRSALEHYMEEVLNTPLDIHTAVELCKYLSSNTLPPNADETGASAASNGEGSSHMIGPDGRPIRSGYLTKKGKNFGGWKSRFFLLDGPLLKYYETPGGAHLGTIKLQNAQIGKQSQSSGENNSPGKPNGSDDMDSQYRHAFLILEPKKKDSSTHVKHVLCAESDKERDAWVDALLQWIDYRDPDDDEPPPQKSSNQSKSSSQAKSSSGRSGGKVKKSNAQVKAAHQGQDSDTLVGLRYDSTQAGEAPQSTHPGRSKNSAGQGEPPGSASEPKVISGPKDPQPISDSAAWGNKSGLAVPSYEEKKARKRSFFGFGPKARSNSDPHESSPTQGGSGPAQPPGVRGPSQQVFGAPLAEAARFNPPADIPVPLPSVVYRCIQYLDSKDAVLEEGIFRLSGSNVVIKQLRERFNTEGDVNLVKDDQFYDIHAVASLLKLYLRELPTTILTRDLHNDFLATTEMDRNVKVPALNELAQRLPLANATLLKYLVAFLINIINNSDMNKMTVRNVGIVFSPTLNIPAPVFAMLLQNYEGIFGIAPEDYKLPVLQTEAERQAEARNQAHHEPPPRFEVPAQRPSTASGTQSPHRHQPRVDSMRDYQRSTPTPPLSNLNPARNSPTPPNMHGRGYEQFPQHAPAHPPGQRPPYENAYANVPMHGGQQPQYPQPRGVPPYERQQYATGPDENAGGLVVQDHSYGSGHRGRRESAMFFGNMPPPPPNPRSAVGEEGIY